MTKFKTALIASLLTLISTSAIAADEAHVPAPEMTSATSYAKVLPVKAPILLSKRAPSQRIARIIKEPVAIPVARKANMRANTKFVFTSPKNTNTKTFIPAAPKNAAMPNLFKK